MPSRAPVAWENVRTPAWAIFGSANLSNSIGIGHQRHDVESSIVFVGDVIAKFRDTHTHTHKKKGLNFHQRTFWLVKTTPFFLQKRISTNTTRGKNPSIATLELWKLRHLLEIHCGFTSALPEKIIDPFGHRPWSPDPDFRPGLPTGHPTANQFRRVKGPTEVGRSRVRRRSSVNFFKAGSPDDFSRRKRNLQKHLPKKTNALITFIPLRWSIACFCCRKNPQKSSHNKKGKFVNLKNVNWKSSGINFTSDQVEET